MIGKTPYRLSPVVTSYSLTLVTDSLSHIRRVTKVTSVTNFLKVPMENFFSSGPDRSTGNEEILHGLLENSGDFDDFGYCSGITGEFCNQFELKTGDSWLQHDEATL